MAKQCLVLSECVVSMKCMNMASHFSVWVCMYVTSIIFVRVSVSHGLSCFSVDTFLASAINCSYLERIAQVAAEVAGPKKPDLRYPVHVVNRLWESAVLRNPRPTLAQVAGAKFICNNSILTSPRHHKSV